MSAKTPMATKTTASYRHKYSVVKTKSGDEKFPIDDAKHAKSALKLLGHAKPPLTSSQKASVRKRAAAFGVTSPAAKKSGKSA
jgi:hypothetical protein